MKSKLFAILMCITMIFSMSSIAFATEDATGGGDPSGDYIDVIAPAPGDSGDDEADILAPPILNINDKKITLAKTTYVYNGKVKKPAVKIEGLVKGTDFTVTYPADCKNAGTKTITIKGIGGYTGTVKKTYKIKKATQNLKITTTKKTVKYSKVKSKAYYATALAVTGAKGTKTFKKVSGSSKLSITSSGKIKVKKGTKWGTYKIKVKCHSKYTRNYKAADTVKTIKVVVQDHATASSYKKYLCKWESVDVSMKVRAMNSHYISAYLINNNTGEKIYFKREVNMTKKPVKIRLKSKYDDDVTLRLKLKYGTPYTDYSGNRVVDGIIFNIDSPDPQWRQGFINPDGSRGYLVFCKYL